MDQWGLATDRGRKLEPLPPGDWTDAMTEGDGVAARGRTRVAVDTLTVSPRSGGIRVYLLELLQSIDPVARESFLLICSASNGKVFSELSGFRRVVVPWPTKSKAIRVASQQLAVPLIARWAGADVLFAPVDFAPLLPLIPTVTAFHSSHINYVEGVDRQRPLKRLYQRIMLPFTVRSSECVIAISDYVSQTLTSQLGLAAQKIVVVHHGGGFIERARRKGWEPKPWDRRSGGVLFVGTLFRHKNVARLIEAYAAMTRKHETAVGLTVAGRDHAGERPRLEGLCRRLGVGDQVTFTGWIGDSEMLRLFSEARLLVTLSELEGFGLPVVEAMQADIPVIIADRGALPEVARGCARRVDPYDTPEVAGAMRAVLTDTELRASMIRCGRERGPHFSWERAAAETCQVLWSAGKR